MSLTRTDEVKKFSNGDLTLSVPASCTLLTKFSRKRSDRKGLNLCDDCPLYALVGVWLGARGLLSDLDYSLVRLRPHLFGHPCCLLDNVYHLLTLPGDHLAVQQNVAAIIRFSIDFLVFLLVVQPLTILGDYSHRNITERVLRSIIEIPSPTLFLDLLCSYLACLMVSMKLMLWTSRLKVVLFTMLN